MITLDCPMLLHVPKCKQKWICSFHIRKGMEKEKGHWKPNLSPTLRCHCVKIYFFLKRKNVALGGVKYRDIIHCW